MRIIFKDTSAKVCTEIGVMTKINDYLLTLSSIEPKNLSINIYSKDKASIDTIFNTLSNDIVFDTNIISDEWECIEHPIIFSMFDKDGLIHAIKDCLLDKYPENISDLINESFKDMTSINSDNDTLSCCMDLCKKFDSDSEEFKTSKNEMILHLCENIPSIQELINLIEKRVN